MDNEIQLFKDTFGCCFNNPKFSDAVIEAGDHKFRVHKLVLASHSTVMDSAFSNGWKETQEGIMKIDDEPAVVEAMLTYMYNFSYIAKDTDDTNTKPKPKPAESGELAQSRGTPLVFHAKVYAIAELYNIPSLKKYAREQFSKILHDGGWETDEFALAVTQVYTSTPDTDKGLRELVVAETEENVETLMDDGGFKALLRDLIGFAADLAEALASGPPEPKGQWYKATCRYSSSHASYFYVGHQIFGAITRTPENLQTGCCGGNGVSLCKASMSEVDSFRKKGKDNAGGMTFW